ncbi:MAG: hypothetical protein HUU22_00615 [Phycisphaerae bacterium]|nr:hypothetical protein [Phycisphaerae bacterium]
MNGTSRVPAQHAHPATSLSGESGTPSDPIAELVMPRAAEMRAAHSERVAPNRPRHPLRRTDALVAIVLFAAAILARWPFIARGETLLHSDEAIVGIMAQDIAEGRRFPVFFYGQRYMGALEAYVIALLRPLFDDPITSLRVGPTLFFAMLTSLQYLMLTRWFGRRGGLIGAATLILAAPMFVQWSISARGGYIESLVWGTLLWWAYWEWFVPPNRDSAHAPASARKKFLLGAILGSGMWINPTIGVFLAPVIAHALMAAPLAAARRDPRLSIALAGLDRTFRSLPMSLPVVVLLTIAVATSIWGMWVVDGRVRTSLLMDMLPRPAAAAVLVIAAIVAWRSLTQRWPVLPFLRSQLTSAGPLIFGALVGLTPTLIYVVRRTLTGAAVEASLPLGLRPMWTIGDPLLYLLRGLPLLLAADGGPFLDLVRVGRSYVTVPVSPQVAAGLFGLNWLVLGGLLTCGVVMAVHYRDELVAALRLRPGPHAPSAFLVLAWFAMLSMYVMGACTFDFTTIRYLVPLWAVVPGLLAATAAADSLRRAAWPAVGCLLFAWALGQAAFFTQLGPPHPLTRLAGELKASQERGELDFALAEPLDAHLLTFLTQQAPPIGEYQSFWPRLAHLRRETNVRMPTNYVVHAADIDWMRDWTDAGWPGRSPPETSRFLWPALKRFLREHPEDVLSRTTLPDGYELWRTTRAIPEAATDS